MSVLDTAVSGLQTMLDVVSLVDPTGAATATSMAVSYFRGNKIDAAAAGESGLIVAFSLVKTLSPAGRLANIACLGLRLTYLSFGAYRMYQGYQEGSWTKMALGALSVLLSFQRACFVAGTQVVVGVNADGSYLTKNIEDIREGDYVLSRDANDPDGALELRLVTDVFVHTVDDLRVLQFTSADGNVEALRTTDAHPF